MGYLCIAFFLMYCYFAYLNFNDPDPVLWVTIYMAAGTVCLLAFFQKAFWYVDIPMCLFYIGYSIKNWPDKWMGFRMPMSHDINIEKGRESVGLLIATATTIFSYIVVNGFKIDFKF